MTEAPKTANIDDAYDDYYAGPKSDHFDGEKFFNPWNPRPKKGLLDVFKWRMTGERAEWPDFVETKGAIPAKPESQDIHVTYIGHASFLVQANGQNILIDPVFSDRASPFSAIGPKRVTKPAFTLDDLPDIHAVFVSHNHYDHMDLPSLAWLAGNGKPHFYTPLGNPRLIKPVAGDCAITALDWHDTAALGDNLSITLTPAQHWSRRGLNDINRDLWGGCFIKSASQSLFYMGDSGFHAGLFEDIQKKHGSPDIALLPIGAYEPRWFMAYSHMNPDEALAVHGILKPKKSMGFHFEAFQLTDEAFDAPRTHTQKSMVQKKIAAAEFHIPYPGDVIKA